MRPRVTDPAPGLAEIAAIWCMRLSEGPLDLQEETDFEAWLAADPRHRLALDEAVATWREIDGAESGPEFLPLRLEALQAVRRAGRRGRSRPVWTRLAAGLGLVTLLAAGGGGVWLAQRPTVYETGVGERRVVVLSDDSKVSLDAATRVEVRYRDGRRELRLDQGRAKFEVAHDPLRPFSVAAADKTVVATGTQFSVELLDRKVRVVLYEGHVAVLGPTTASGAPQPVRLATHAAPADQALVPGRELIADQAAGAATVIATDPGRTLAWEGGQLVFVDEPLTTAVERINRYSQAKVAVGDAAAGDVKITGVFTAGDTRAFIEGVTAVFPVAARPRGDETVLVSKAIPVG